ncbi:hypothetical protein ES705_50694 [subsurface metagenome]
MVAIESNWSYVARIKPVYTNRFLYRFFQFFLRIRYFHLIQIRRPIHPIHVLLQPEDKRTFLRGIASYPLEDARPVMQTMRENVHFRFLPLHKLSFIPYFTRFW